MNVLLRLAPLFVAVVFATTACSGHEEDGDESDAVAEGELGAATASLARGRFLMKGTSEAARSINEVFLLPSGSFYADFHTNMSSVSGHHFPAAGKYAVESAAGKEHLVFTYSLDPQFPPRGERYELQRRSNGELELRFDMEDGTTLEPFVLEHVGKRDVATITFGADWSVRKKGKLTADGVLELRYDLARAKCDPPRVESLVSVDGGRAKSLVVPGQASPRATVAMPVPAGDHIALWFRNVGGFPECEAWDSDFGRNFNFTIR